MPGYAPALPHPKDIAPPKCFDGAEFPTGLWAPGLDVSELRDDVSAEGELRTLGAGPEAREAPAAEDGLAIKGRRVVQGRVVANLRPEGDRLEQRRSRRNRWRDVEAAGDLEIGGGRGGEHRRAREAVLEVDEVEITGVGRHEEVLVVAPNLDTSNGLQPFVDGVDGVLRPAIAGRLDPAIVADVVEIGDEGPGVVDFPCGRDVVEKAQRAVGIAASASRDADWGVRVLRPEMGGGEDREVAIQKI